ncbi:hypothetical protein M011DRAFT_454272 [Sporormia fimetaria CBS 119925]|uniref:protein-tyrosine-phosphatase n=1 Tax=Sporormia fimetaria CBS 119925 TaxID=1340428 RepID=A0A6A6UWE5_9PLEO|nr:hypothetical protein M011DRAFT_454272 [Sporormia fimetaria CBS 119925]
MITITVQTADSPTLKRAFAPDLVHNTSSPSKKCARDFSRCLDLPSPSPHPPYRRKNPENPPSRSDKHCSRSRRPRMVETNRRTLVPPMPTFMSVFGGEIKDTESINCLSTTKFGTHGSVLGRPASSGNIPSGTNFAAFHVHRDSTSTLASDSTDSSPTTTISTMDSSSVTDASAGPSPESPVAKPAPSSFVADFRSRRPDTGSSDSSPNTFFELQRPTTPAKKARNLKNLGINTSASLSNLRSNPTGSLPLLANKERNTSAPTSPSFNKPPTPPKRRPSNLSLTIQTPGSDSKPIRLVIPSTPAQNRPALRHFQSSPSLPSCSPNGSAPAGVRLPALRPLKTNPHGFAEVPIEQEEEDQEPNFDIPQSREEKPAAYPNGPVCIYESGVYLYFEPTIAEATSFDVIVNVASEVKNPFINPSSQADKDLDARRVDGPPAESVDFTSLPERSNQASSKDNGSPTTPKATPVLETLLPGEKLINGSATKTPEYIHMPWEHNTDIVADLHKLVKIMDDRVKQGKRVLVHCQCGVSRSASLIVAYGLYKNPGISVQEAYDAVKKRSKWIGPNMNLIMQLQEFRNGLLRANESRSHTQGYGYTRRSAGLPTGVSLGNNMRSPFHREASTGPRTPRTAPLPPESDLNLQRASTGNMMSISPGPLSAPSGSFFSPDYRRSWAPSQTQFDISPTSSPKGPYVDTQGQVVAVPSVAEAEPVPSLPTLRADPPSDVQEPSKPSRQSTVPNFSRQLLFRNTISSEGDQPSGAGIQTLNVGLTAPALPLDISGMRSPLASSFNIPHPPTVPQSSETQAPAPLSFSSYGPSWCDDGPPMSPMASEFRMTFPRRNDAEKSHDFSPHATNFNLPSESRRTDDDDFELRSPIATEFPKDPFARSSDAGYSGLVKPTAADFDMTPLKRIETNDDPYGLTSPTRFEFSKNPFESVELAPPSSDNEYRRPSFQAILPPSHLIQPETSNGFVSLDGTAQALPKPSLPMANSRTDSANAITSAPRETAPIKHFQESVPSNADNGKTVSLDSTPSKPAERIFLSTPPRLGIRTRFSSPNMREQRKLHKLQTEMEALLPSRSPKVPQALDDLDALMSPRAEEFTRNPFHLHLQSPTDETSPASSTETIIDVSKSNEWKQPVKFSSSKVAEDPRSPVQPGGSPIVRNIWDVL